MPFPAGRSRQNPHPGCAAWPGASPLPSPGKGRGARICGARWLRLSGGTSAFQDLLHLPLQLQAQGGDHGRPAALLGHDQGAEPGVWDAHVPGRPHRAAAAGCGPCPESRGLPEPEVRPRLGDPLPSGEVPAVAEQCDPEEQSPEAELDSGRRSPAPLRALPGPASGLCELCCPGAQARQRWLKGPATPGCAPPLSLWPWHSPSFLGAGRKHWPVSFPLAPESTTEKELCVCVCNTSLKLPRPWILCDV